MKKLALILFGVTAVAVGWLTGPMDPAFAQFVPSKWPPQAVTIVGSVPISDGGSSITVDGTVTANQGSKNASQAEAWWMKLTDGSTPVAARNQAGDLALGVFVAGSTGGPADVTAQGHLMNSLFDYNGTDGAEITAVHSLLTSLVDGTTGSPIASNGAGSMKVVQYDNGGDAMQVTSDGRGEVSIFDYNGLNGVNVTAGNRLEVDGSGVTQPVSHATLSVVGSGVEASALRVSLATDGMAVPLGTRGTGASNASTLRVVLADESIAGISTGAAVTPYYGDMQNGAETAVDNTADQVGASTSTAVIRILQNVGSTDVRCGKTGVTSTTGIRLAPGDILSFTPPYVPGDALFCITASGSSTVLYQTVTF